MVKEASTLGCHGSMKKHGTLVIRCMKKRMGTGKIPP